MLDNRTIHTALKQEVCKTCKLECKGFTANVEMTKTSTMNGFIEGTSVRCTQKFKANEDSKKAAVSARAEAAATRA